MSLFFFSVVLFCYIASGQDNINIVSIDTWVQHSRAWCNITCSDGITGFGQLGKYYKYKNDIYATQKVFIDEIVPNILNYSCTTEPFNVMNHVMIQSYKNTGQFQSRALAGVAMAIYEIHAKRENKLVGDYLGGDTTKSIPIYGSSTTRSESPKKIGDNFVNLINEWGINQFKFKIAQRMGNNTDVYPNRTQEVVTTIREMVGNNITLMVDANGGYTEWKYVEPVVKLLNENNILWFEEPVPWWEYKNVQNITKQIRNLNFPIKIALGEQEYRMIDGWQDMINNEYVDIIQPDSFYGGGFANFMQIAEWSLNQQDSFKSVVIPHSPNNQDFTVVVTMHFMSLKHGPFPNVGWWMEFGCDSGIPTKDSDFYFTPKLIINKNGTVNINNDPNAIGWGYTIRPSNITNFHHYHT